MYICHMIQFDDPDIYEKSNHSIAVDLGRRFKQYRIALGLTQKDIASHTGLSVMTIVRFEKGEVTSLGLDNFIAMMRAIQILDNINNVIPDIPQSLYTIKQPKVPQRVGRKRKK